VNAKTATPASGDDVMAEINITPFTDVLLVLTMIFMILAAVDVPGFQKAFDPCAHGLAAGRHALREIEVAVSASGAISIDGAPVRRAGLYPAMAAAVRAHTHRSGYTQHVALSAANAAPYAAIIRVLDAARQAGDDDVGFVTY